MSHIDENETLKRFGYTSDILSSHSNKKIVVKCDYCGDFIEKRMGKYTRGIKEIQKNCCSKIDCMKSKRGEVNIKKFGSSSPFSNKEVQEKIKETMLEKYGVEKPLQNKEIYNRLIETNIEKYGTENVFQSEEIKSKIIETMKDKYGVEHPMQSDVIKNKLKESLLQKYGVDSPLKSEEIKNRMIQTCIDKFGVSSYAKTKEFSDFMHELARRYDGKTLKELASESNKAYSTFVEQVNKYGLENAMKIDRRRTGIELIITEWLNNENIKFEEQVTIKPYRVDFLIDNICLEIDGLYWHSDAVNKNKNYHKDKMNIYIENNFIPLFFRENEILNKFEIVKSIIRNRIKLSDRVFARNCKIRLINKKEAKEFLDCNHLMGSGSGKSYGLVYKDEIVSIIQLKNKNPGTIEVSRFCNKLNISVLGGFSKLIKYITNHIEFKTLINFIDLRYGTGKYLEKFGFVKEKEYLSFNWTDFTNTFHRMKFPSNTGYENGLFKIWDCGQRKYVLIKY